MAAEGVSDSHVIDLARLGFACTGLRKDASGNTEILRSVASRFPNGGIEVRFPAGADRTGGGCYVNGTTNWTGEHTLLIGSGEGSAIIMTGNGRDDVFLFRGLDTPETGSNRIGNKVERLRIVNDGLSLSGSAVHLVQQSDFSIVDSYLSEFFREVAWEGGGNVHLTDVTTRGGDHYSSLVPGSAELFISGYDDLKGDHHSAGGLFLVGTSLIGTANVNFGLEMESMDTANLEAFYIGGPKQDFRICAGKGYGVQTVLMNNFYMDGGAIDTDGLVVPSETECSGGPTQITLSSGVIWEHAGGVDVKLENAYLSKLIINGMQLGDHSNRGRSIFATAGQSIQIVNSSFDHVNSAIELRDVRMVTIGGNQFQRVENGFCITVSGRASRIAKFGNVDDGTCLGSIN